MRTAISPRLAISRRLMGWLSHASSLKRGARRGVCRRRLASLLGFETDPTRAMVSTVFSSCRLAPWLSGSQQPLGLSHRFRPVAAQAQGLRSPFGQQLIRRAAPVRHVEAAGGHRIERLGAEHQGAGLAHSHGAHHVGLITAGTSPRLTGEAEAGVIGGQHRSQAQMAERSAVGGALHQRHRGEGSSSRVCISRASTGRLPGCARNRRGPGCASS